MISISVVVGLGADFVIYGSISKINEKSFRSSFYLVEIYFDRVVASANKTHSCTDIQLIDIVPQNILEGLNLNVQESYLSVTSNPPNAKLNINNKLIGELPIKQFSIEPGQHEIMIQKSGYENSKISLDINNRASLSRKFILQPKRKSKAVNKSILFPGMGQIYSSDETHIGRKIIGLSFFAAECVYAGSTVIQLIQYLENNSDYDRAYDIYKSQTNVNEIEYHKQIVNDKYEILNNTQKQLVNLLSISGGIWVVNIFEAYINFPDYGIGSEKISRLNNDTNIGITFEISF